MIANFSAVNNVARGLHQAGSVRLLTENRSILTL